VSGSAYTYAYASLGEFVAWIIGWDLIIEYAVGNVAVAISWAGYLRELLAQFGLHLPAWITVDYRTARVWDTPPGTAQEAPVLARLLEALGRHRVNDLGALEEIPSKAMPESWSDLQREAETSPDNDTKRVIRWLLADPATRPASPLAMPVPATRVK